MEGASEAHRDEVGIITASQADEQIDEPTDKPTSECSDDSGSGEHDAARQSLVELHEHLRRRVVATCSHQIMLQMTGFNEIEIGGRTAGRRFNLLLSACDPLRTLWLETTCIAEK